MEDVNDLSQDVRNGFICGAWRPIQQYDGVFVMRCDRPDGHKGYHWDGPTPQETKAEALKIFGLGREAV